MDNETKKIKSEREKIRDLVGHEGWPIARKKLHDAILDLQNAFNVEDKDPQSMMIDLQARKIATKILFDWLNEIEGTATQASENLPIKKNSYIINDEE